MLACAIASYIVLFGWLSLARHATFNTHALDLGYTVNAVWNTAHGRPFYFSTYQEAGFQLDIPLKEIRQVDNLLAYHVEPLLGFVALLYRLWEDPRLLLLLQSIVLALGALPAYGLARLRLCRAADVLRAHRIIPRFSTPATSRNLRPSKGSGRFDGRTPLGAYLALAFPLIYLLAPTVEAANLSDFHVVAMSPTFLLAAFYFLERRQPWWTLWFALLALLCREEIALLVTMLGLYVVLFRRRWVLGAALTAVGIGWFVLCVNVILPHFNGLSGSAFLVRYQHFGHSLAEIAHNLLHRPALFWDWLKQPQVVDYFRVLLGSAGGLAVLAPEVLALAGPVLAANAFSSYPWMHSAGGHYSASISAFLVIAAIHGTDRLARGLAWIVRRVRRVSREQDHTFHVLSASTVVVLLLVSGLTHVHYGISPISRRFRVPLITAHHRIGHEVLAMVPPNAPVSAQTGLYPHLADRRQAYLFPTVADAEYVVLDVTAETYPVTLAFQHGRVEDLIYGSQFGILAAKDGFLLLKRNLTAAYHFPEGFFSFARVDEHGQKLKVPHLLHADFGELELVGYNLLEQPVVTAAVPPITIETYWRATHEAALAYQFVPYFVQGDGAIGWVYGHGTATALYYPTYAWQPGELVRVTFPPHTTAGFREIYLGVVRWGGELLRIDDRLPILAAESKTIEQNTLLLLTTLP
jgi:uncharacterized membrane protein